MDIFPVRPGGGFCTVSSQRSMCKEIAFLCILALCNVFGQQTLLLHFTGYFVPHSSSCYDVLEISLKLFVLSTIFCHTSISLVEIFASFDHGFGV